MSKQRTELEWQVLDEQSESPQAAILAELPAERPSHNQRPYRLHTYAAVAALIILVGGVWLWLQAERGVEQIEGELQEVAQSELWVAANHDIERAIDLAADPMAAAWHQQFARDDSTFALLQAITPDSPLAVELNVVELDEDWAEVEARISSADKRVAYRQTRFYRHTNEGWLRTAPSAERWGTQVAFESDSFVFTFRQDDAEVVAAVAPQLEILYSSLRRDLGLAASSGGTKVVIEISPTELPGAALLRAAPTERFVVPSPSFYLAPVSVSDDELVLQSLALLLVPSLLEETISSNEIHWMRAPMRSALWLWLLWDLDLPLASVHEEIVQWRLTGMPAAKQGETAPLPHNSAELCALYGVWLTSPMLLSIPLTCNEQDNVLMVAPPPDTLSRAELELLAENTFWQASSLPNSLQWGGRPGDTVILTTLLEYIVSRYGREQLPALLAALGWHRSWATLSPAVFDLSATEFAAGWHDFLVEKYGVAR